MEEVNASIVCFNDTLLNSISEVQVCNEARASQTKELPLQSGTSNTQPLCMRAIAFKDVAATK